MNCHNCHRASSHNLGGFTLVEAIVAVGIVGVAFTSCLGALALMNSMASVSRNYTGAYVAIQKRIDWALSAAPFNPQNNQFPADGTVQLSPGTYTETNVAVYNEAQAGFVNGLLQLLTNPSTPNTTFSGSMTTTVVDVSPTPNASPYIYRINVTINYTYRNRNYSLSMNTLRTSDT